MTNENYILFKVHVHITFIIFIYDIYLKKPCEQVDTTQYRLNARAGDFRPTHLIRVSDLEKVPGEEATNGYCALSYCWEQSGEIVQENDGYKCIDNDFQIEYLWYDKVCIDQSDMKARQQEIKQMHRIYGNACYTVAFIPEVGITDSNNFHTISDKYPSATKAHIEAVQNIWVESSWRKRSWTLEEVMMSKRILIVGANANLWQHSLHTCNIPITHNLFSAWMLDFHNQHGGGGSANQALSEAHFRTSSREHDKIFSLASIFHDMFKDIKNDYTSDVKTTFHNFYRTVATNDLSILCFGSDLELDESKTHINTMKDYQLPTWTGVDGAHSRERVTTTTALMDLPHYICDGMLLHISTKYYKTLFILPFGSGGYTSESRGKQLDKQIFDMKRKRQQSMRSYLTEEEKDALLNRMGVMYKTTNCFPTHHQHQEGHPPMKIVPLSLTEDCEECTILPILFKTHYVVLKDAEETPALKLLDGYFYSYLLPVFKRCMNSAGTTRYKAIGVYYLGNQEDKDFCIESDNPDKILKAVFGDEDAIHDDVEEFIIE
ncbi:hypothetical protein BDA99DRAFT_594265 [Phascolomyces articulosus]|uniref:Heterokaryon incompatibility domain-containing protein n=1 Tax=Phascolomyces articulosus TaxID=60185 RepID=A0AAD5JWX0_9FUNG|nr:hypothetical protein BDA99DRAFT_594265 [Phascolomyces articulosus]